MTKVPHIDTLLLSDGEEDILRAAEIIRDGGLVAFPTETVYGLGANALDPEAVGKVYAAKGRPSDNPMIVHVAHISGLGELTPVITDDMKSLARAFWPGPLTLVVDRKERVPDVTTGGLDTVGVRMPSNPVARRLIELSGVPIAAPSANISGRPSPTSSRHVEEDLKGRIDAIIRSSDSEYGLESTVVDMTGEIPMVLRPGVVTREMLETALGREVKIDPGLLRRAGEGLEVPEFRPKAPGMKYRHYAPKAEMTIFSGDVDKARSLMEERRKAMEARGKKVAVLDFGVEAEEAAKNLFAALRQADEDGADIILALAIPEEGLGFAVMNRMLKSAGYNVVEV